MEVEDVEGRRESGGDEDGERISFLCTLLDALAKFVT